MHSFSIEGTHAPLASELSCKVTSSLQHPIIKLINWTMADCIYCNKTDLCLVVVWQWCECLCQRWW